MRPMFPSLVAAMTLVAAGALPAAEAADLDYTGQASWFSCGEPWASVAERPPQRGRWYFAGELPPTVNFIVPCGSRLRPVPGTAEWVAYCQQRWPSFNPATGWIVTPDGPRRCI